MISYAHGNLLDAEVEVLVNAVNTAGIMGKGIALMFKERFPENFVAYTEACKAGRVRTGSMFVTRVDEPGGARWIINFPTKQHWRNPSKLEWVRDGLADLREVIEERKIRSIALPRLGCGLGGLDWEDVRPLIESALGDLEDVEIVVYDGP